MCLKCKEEVTNSLVQIDLIENDYGIAFELFLLAINIKRKVYGVLESFLLFFKNMKKKISQHFMFDARPFKSFCLVFFFIGCEKGVSIVEEYDTRSLYLMLLKC